MAAPSLDKDVQRLIHACSRPENVTLLVGAGVSIDEPSGIPPAAPVMRLLGDWLSRRAPDVRKAMDELLAPAACRHPYLGPYATLRFELLLEWVSYLEPRVLDVLADCDKDGSPNRWHWWIADMIAGGATVLTTNFDSRIEMACRALQMKCSVVHLTARRVSADAIDRAQLIKLHGSFAKTRRGRLGKIGHAPMMTLRQLARWGLAYERLGAARKSLMRLIRNRTLIVCGYSGWDSFDVMPLLEDGRRTRPLFWFDRTTGGLAGRAAQHVDDLVTENPGVTPLDAFLSERAPNSPHVCRIVGNEHEFVDAVWKREREQQQRAFLGGTALGDVPAVGPDETLTRMRHALFAGDMNAGTVGARAVVRRLRMAQGVDIANAGLGLRSRPSGPPPRMQRETQVLAALERGDVGFAADYFLGDIRRHELATDPNDLQQYADTATGILADLFWIAIRLGRRSQAGAMIRQLLHEARRRGGLWAYVEAMYLRANLLHDQTLSDRVGRSGKGPFRQKARALLREATRYAIRIPRPEFVVDAIRLSVYLEPDGDERRRLLNGLEVWGGRVAPGEEKFLAFFDLVRHQVESFDRIVPIHAYRELRRAVRQRPDLATGGAYVAIAACYMAFARGQHRAFSLALGRLDQVIGGLDRRVRTDFLVESRKLHALV